MLENLIDLFVSTKNELYVQRFQVLRKARFLSFRFDNQ